MTTPTNSDRLREIKERAEKATPGPWKRTGPWYPSDPKTRNLPDAYSNVAKPGEGSIADCWPWTDHQANAEFIAASREDIPFLLSEIDKLRAEKAETIEVLEEMKRLDWYSDTPNVLQWRSRRAEPHLDKLKAES